MSSPTILPTPADPDAHRNGRRPRRWRAGLAAVLIAPLLAGLAACGGSSTPASGSAAAGSTSGGAGGSEGSEGTYPLTVTADNGQVSIAKRPTSIVSLAPSLTEMLFAVGAGGQVKAVDDQSNYPTGVPTTKLSGFQPNAEAIAGYQPDLVVISSDANGLVAALTKLKVPVLLLKAPNTLDAAYAQEKTLGTVTGHLSQAERVIAGTKARIDAAVAATPKAASPPKVYHELDQTYFSADGTTFIGSVYTKLGLKNIADGAKKAAGGYPQLSAEYVVSSAPDLIVLADGKCCQQSAATVAKRSAFATVPAVKNGKVVVMDDDIASRWGPRVADFVEQVATALGAKITH
jgi:iron complex transport system substrate-binding protein